MCINCIRNEVDITEGIPKSSTVHFCKNCERYLQPPNSWVVAQLESRELLALCLKKLKGLSKVRLVDAGFIWTEPHSRRIKVKLTIQKEVFASTVIQQVFVVEYVVCTQQCEDCMRIMAKNTWKASVQVRQKVNHKRTFFFLEQLILKHNAHKDTVNIKTARDGIDFYYANRNHAIKMLEFLQNVVPCKSKSSEQLISTDIHNNTSNYKFTYSVEIVPICKDDLVCLPKKVARSLGNISQIVLCTRISNHIQLLDPNTLAVADLSTTVYYRQPIHALSTASNLTQFYVIDIEPSHVQRGKWLLCDVQVGRMSDDAVFATRSHLGNILKVGDTVLGYDLSRANFNNEHFEDVDVNNLNEVILVKKSYPDRRKANKPRKWKLKSLAADTDESALNNNAKEQAKIENDYEAFLRDLEEDTELRSSVNLYKNTEVLKRQEEQRLAGMQQGAMDQDDEDQDFPEVSLEELLDDLTLNDDGPDDEEVVGNQDGHGDVMME
ncbi:NMD3 family-domain-containing protein [Paraphysoderma sedebokerense]|nr:NMD3 family-domain-containing protein [Paraphysoderma sedebokerense]